MSRAVSITAGRVPIEPVRSDQPPADYLCTWRIVDRRATRLAPAARFWELKYINTSCLEHRDLAWLPG